MEEEAKLRRGSINELPSTPSDLGGAGLRRSMFEGIDIDGKEVLGRSPLEPFGHLDRRSA